MEDNTCLTIEQKNAMLIEAIGNLMIALDRIAFRSNTLGQKKDIARKAVWAIPQDVLDMIGGTDE